MSTDPEVTRIVRSWLDEGVDELPERVMDAVIDQVGSIPQRRRHWPTRRLPNMNRQVRVFVAAAAVVVVALVALTLLPRAGGVGGAPPTAEPSPTVLTDFTGVLTPGTYVATDPFLVRTTFTVPAGWQIEIAGPYAVFLTEGRGPAQVNFSILTDVDASPCQASGLSNPPPGPTVDDLAGALANLPGVGVTPPSDVTLGGYQGKQLTLTAPASFATCKLTPAGTFEIWQLPLGATNDLTPGEVDRVWILQVADQRLVIDAPQIPGESAADTAAVEGILNSIHLAPHAPEPTPPGSATP